MTMTREQIRENLLDAGCSENTIEQYEALDSPAQRQAQLRILRNHRQALLDSIHAEQKKLDCLDYLIYSIQDAQ